MIDISKDYCIGNEKGSAMKLMILFQEIIFNAIKDCVFVERDKRYMKLEIKDINGMIYFEVENSFNDAAKSKSSGLGHQIIENFAKLLNADIMTDKENGKYTVKLPFKNLWRGE